MSKESARRVIGIDYGTRQIGFAYLDTAVSFATPLHVIRNPREKPDWPRIEALLAEWQPDLCVVGLPLNMDGSESELARRAQRFARQLQERPIAGKRLPVELFDERLTTRAAKELLGEQGASASQAADSLAAKLILDGWLDSQTD